MIKKAELRKTIDNYYKRIQTLERELALTQDLLQDAKDMREIIDAKLKRHIIYNWIFAAALAVLIAMRYFFTA